MHESVHLLIHRRHMSNLPQLNCQMNENCLFLLHESRRMNPLTEHFLLATITLSNNNNNRCDPIITCSLILGYKRFKQNVLYSHMVSVEQPQWSCRWVVFCCVQHCADRPSVDETPFSPFHCEFNYLHHIWRLLTRQKYNNRSPSATDLSHSQTRYSPCRRIQKPAGGEKNLNVQHLNR